MVEGALEPCVFFMPRAGLTSKDLLISNTGNYQLRQIEEQFVGVLK